MSSRERRLAWLLLGLLAVGGGWAEYLLLVRPILELRDKAAKLQNDLDTKQAQLAREKADLEKIYKIDPRLKEWKQLSLPEPPKFTAADAQRGLTAEDVRKQHFSRVQVAYQDYLDRLLRNDGFMPASIKITPRTVDSKSSPQLANKQPVYNRFTYSVTGVATLRAVLQTMEDFYRTQLLHEIRKLTLKVAQVGRQGAQRGDLEVTMEIEALLVTGADSREPQSALLASLTNPPSVLADPKRDYTALLAKNMFQGTVMWRQNEDPYGVLRNVKVVSLIENGRRWEASLLDVNQPAEDGKGGARTIDGLNTITVDAFVIYDAFDNIVLDAKVVHIDRNGMVFRADGKFYRAEVGEPFSTVMRKQVSNEELKSLGLAAAPSSEETTGVGR
jgi:hypothetical protein